MPSEPIEPLFNSWTDEELLCIVRWCIANRNHLDLVLDPVIVRRVFNAYAGTRLAVADAE